MQRCTNRVAKQRQEDIVGRVKKKNEKKIPNVLMQVASTCNKPTNSKGSKIKKTFII